MSSSQKSILIVSHAFPPDVGGAQNVAVQNARSLSQSYNVEVLTGTPAASEWDERYDFEVTRLNVVFGLWPLYYAVAFASRRENSYEAVILNDPAAIYASGLFAPSSLLSRGVAYLHGSEPEFFFTSPKLLYRLVRFRHYLKEGLKGCQVIVPVSKYMKRKFVKQTGLDHLESKMQVAYAGVDHKVFYPDPLEVRQLHDIDKSSDILLSASRIVRRKGYDKMLSIFKKLHKVEGGFHWIIAGNGPYRQTLLHNLEQAGFSHAVTVLGEVSQEELRRYYSSVDVFWLLSRFLEAFGLVYIEANACGLPVIGYSNGGVAEAIKDGKSGFLVEDTADCLDILRSRRYRKVEERDVLQHAEKFKLDNTFEKLRKIIHDM